METNAHIDFIAAAYAAATLDCRAQTRKLADLELQGMTRRSEMVSDRPASRAAETAREQAEEQA
jgi:hypothetical protein